MGARRKGFTLIELLIVVLIIGILAAIAIPKFSNVKQKAYKSQAVSDLTSLRVAEETFYADSNRYGQLSELATFSSTNGLGITLIGNSTSYWSATVTHPHLPGMVCAVAIATVNPVDAGAGEGEPVCK
jgi:prepilin-type N-terminal cleavage/methylation domain-containing protein